MRTTKVSISVPNSMKLFIDKRVEVGEYGSMSEYFRELIRLDQHRTIGQAMPPSVGQQSRPERPPLASAARRGPEPGRYTSEEVRQMIAASERRQDR